MAHSASTTLRLRNDGKCTFPSPYELISSNPLSESWVEISSQPSSSSLSSIGDEIVTTGLRVQQEPTARRRRRSQSGFPVRTSLQGRQMSTSSQEEYEESESEEDQVMTSSNEHISSFARRLPISHSEHNSASDSESDDENATALGRVTDESAFTPQPNAFSHPPSSNNGQRQSFPGSYFPRSIDSPSMPQRQSYPGRGGSRAQHSPYNAISHSHQVDHDAALRASLTTLLSCAAAARGLPKRNQNGAGMAGPSTTTSTRPEFTGFSLVPESELTRVSPVASRPLSPNARARSSPSISEQEAVIDKGKRKAAANSRATAQARASKKKRMTAIDEAAMISPTLLTWVVSAGVVVLVSVVGFGAGYAMGKEVGRQEILGGIGEVDCKKEAARSVGELRKFRFGNARGIVA
jgi:hypothetical protein